jgi:paired amphipathic helix protein Sin3a
MPPPPLPHMAMLPVPHPIQTPPDELLFFERAKRTLESKDAYEEFLKLLTLYSKDIIDAKTLMDLSQVFLGDGDLLAQFKDVLHIDECQSTTEHGPPGSIRTGPPEPLPALPADEGEGPSYRKLPDSVSRLGPAHKLPSCRIQEVNLACSNRDELCRSVLNDVWVSHPTWASEEAGFISHKKNSFEEALHKSEEERHEYHVQLEALARTIALFEPLTTRIDEMTNEERATFRLKADFGGSSRSVYHRTLKKVYGRDASTEVIQALQDCPSVAVPVVLARLKAKDEEWRRIQREWNKTWREVDAKNFYKSLDHQGNQFKQNDKKHITAKHFVQHIEGVKEAQEHKVAQRRRPSFAAGSVGHQLGFEFPQTSVLHDSLRLVYSFLDHSQAQYSPPERRAIEGFLRQFVPLLYMFPAHEFDAACGPSDDDDLEHDTGSRSATTGDFRKPLSRSSDARDTASLTPTLPHATRSSDVWIRTTQACTDVNDVPRRRPFFVNTTIYTLLCLLQVAGPLPRLTRLTHSGYSRSTPGWSPARTTVPNMWRRTSILWIVIPLPSSWG